jgi:hypothetical protein
MITFEQVTFPNFPPARNPALLKSFITNDLGYRTLMIRPEFMDISSFHTLQGLFIIFWGITLSL